MEKRALGWDTTYDKGGKIFSTRYETEPFDGASKEKGGPDYRGRHTYSKTREVTPDDPYYKNAVKTLAKRRKKNRFVKEAEERNPEQSSWLKRQLTIAKIVNKPDVKVGRLKAMVLPSLIGAGIAGSAGAILNAYLARGKYVTLGNALAGAIIGGLVGSADYNKEYLKKNGVVYGKTGFNPQFSREAAKKYITGMDKQAGKIKQAIRERKAEKKQYDGGRAPRRLRTPRTTAGVLLQLSRMQ